MLAFWIIAILMLLVSLAVIAFTLFKYKSLQENKNSAAIELYQQHLVELENDIENGLINESEAEQIRQEMQLSLLKQDEKAEAPIQEKKPDKKSSMVTTFLLLFLVPTFVIALYFQLGRPDIVKQAAVLSEFNQAKTNEEKMVSIEKMLSQLEQRMINTPDDVDGWLMLTNSYTALERYPEALRAIDNLHRLRKDDPTVMLRYADILSMANGGIFAGKPTELINQALEIDPENANGLWLGGLAAHEQGDIYQAVEYWQRLLPKLDQDVEAKKQIEKFILAAKQQLIAIDHLAEEITINVNVSLSEDLLDDTQGDETVFIYAKAIDGPPIPLAVIKTKVSDLPSQINLNDSQAMLPEHKLSAHENVTLIARVSKSGNAEQQIGDLVGRVESVNTGLETPIDLVIDQKIQ